MSVGIGGAEISIPVTVAVALHVIPIRFWKVKMNIPFPVNICQVAFSHVIFSENPVMVAMIF